MFFTTIRDAIVERHDELGAVRSLIMDFEQAAHDSARAVMGIQTRGCLFHFGQCLIRRLQKEGAMTAYETNLGGVREWVGLLKSMALLPPELVQYTWNNWISNPPHVHDPLLQAKLQRFAAYFQGI